MSAFKGEGLGRGEKRKFLYNELINCWKRQYLDGELSNINNQEIKNYKYRHPRPYRYGALQIQALLVLYLPLLAC